MISSGLEQAVERAVRGVGWWSWSGRSPGAPRRVEEVAGEGAPGGGGPWRKPAERTLAHASRRRGSGRTSRERVSGALESAERRSSRRPVERSGAGRDVGGDGSAAARRGAARLGRRRRRNARRS